MVTLTNLRQQNKEGKPITMVNAYDAAMARLVDESNIDLILVGDSVGIPMLGYDGTDRVTLDEMVHHAAAVTRVVEKTPVVVDLPFGTYNVSPGNAVRNANRLKKEGGADAIKLEGGSEIVDVVDAITEAGIPVFGHMGVTPQTTGGLAVQGTTADDARGLIEDARALDEAGAEWLVLELVAAEAAKQISEAIDAITIGIGSGADCDAQVVLLHDLLGLQDVLPETAAGIGGDLDDAVLEQFNQFHNAVNNGEFPGDEATETMAEDEANDLSQS
jgi:3-methyl-2-oxobutanoate hydroxymethyltransferase